MSKNLELLGVVFEKSGLFVLLCDSSAGVNVIVRSGMCLFGFADPAAFLLGCNSEIAGCGDGSILGDELLSKLK
jgi:hypothetical protein